MAGFGLLHAMTLFQLDRVCGPLKEIVALLDLPGALQQLSLHDDLLLIVIGAYIAWLLLLCWYSGIVFKACWKHLSDWMSR